jgi:CBS domain-containing protein
MNTAVRDVMTSRVVCVRHDASFKEMATALRENRVSAFPVLNGDGEVIGVVSEADLLTKQALDGGYDGMPGMITGLLRRREQGKARGMTAGDLMTGPAVTVVPEAAVQDAARLMSKRKVKRLPVVDGAGRLAGIISRADVLSAFDDTDTAIRRWPKPASRPADARTDEERTMTMKTSVQDAMTTQVVAVKLGASFREMAARLRQSRVSAFPVIDDDGKVIGVVSEADMLASKVLSTGMPHRGEQDRGEQDRGDQDTVEELTAGDLMTHPAITVSPGDSVEVAARLMYTLQVKRLPVIDRSGRLAGIISRTDVLAVFDRSDEQIRKEVTDDVICQEFGASPRQFAVTVQAGVVTLEGHPETVALGHVIVRKVRHVRGVVAVRDRLSYPDASASIAGPGL